MLDEKTGYASIDKPWLKYYPNNVYDTVTENIDEKIFDFMHSKNIDDLNDYALSYFGRKITYGEMFREIENYAKILKGYGIGKNDIVSLCLPNIPETVYLKYALNRIGAISNMIDPRQSSQNILSFVNDTNSKLLFCILDACELKINPIIDKLKVDDVVILSVSDSLNMNTNLTSSMVNLMYKIKKNDYINKNKNYKSKYKFNDDLNKFYTDYLNVDTNYEPDDVATIMYTSGTTGTAKGAMLTNEAYNTMHNQLQYTADFRRKDTFFGAIPFFSAYGSFCGMHNSLCSGQEIILLPKIDPNKIDKTLLKYKPNISFLVPGYWESFSNSKKANKKDLSYMKIIVAGGDKWAPASINIVNDFLKKQNCEHKARVGYGATEFGGAVSVVPESDLYIAGSAGLVLPSCNAMVIDRETNEELKYNEIGEICISSPTMMKGYINKEEETNQLVIVKNNEKFYKTGDQGYINEDGIIFVIDRYKRSMMRPDGHTVHATPIENTILENENVEKCCVVGLKIGDKAGDIPTAFIKVKNKTNIEDFINELDNYCLKYLAERDRALAYVLVDEMPYNLMGKIDYRKLEQMNIKDLDIIVVDNTFFKEKNNKKILKLQK